MYLLLVRNQYALVNKELNIFLCQTCFKFTRMVTETLANLNLNDICPNGEVSLASMSFEEKEAMNTHMHLRDTLCSVNGKQSHKTAILVQLYEFPQRPLG